MDFKFRPANINELDTALEMLKEAAKHLQSKNINQWDYWLNPLPEKVNWIKEGFQNEEFNFIIQADEIIGMFRLLKEDELYWGKEKEAAKYIHSLVIKGKYAGRKLGQKVIERIIENTIAENIYILRLDCNSKNARLCNYYEKQGFTKVREKQMPHSLNNLYEKRLYS